MTDPEFILFIFPKLLGAQICTGSRVVGIFQIHLEELEAGGFTASYHRVISAVSNVLSCSDDGRYIQILINVSKFMLPIVFYSFRFKFVFFVFFYSNIFFFLFLIH